MFLKGTFSEHMNSQAYYYTNGYFWFYLDIKIFLLFMITFYIQKDKKLHDCIYLLCVLYFSVCINK